jgi:thiol-disulfide isomerase/thioredoxin
MNHSNLSPALIFIILFNLLLLSCSKDQSGGPVIVAGHLPDLLSKEIKCEINGREYRTTTDAEGRFHMALELTHHQYPWFNGINRNLYLLPGDSLYITSGTSLDFSGGESGLINTYYTTVDTHLGGLTDTVDIKWYYSQEPGPFSDLVNQLISDFTRRLDHYVSENPGIGKDFIALEKERIRHYWFYELNTYYDEYKAYTGMVPDLPADFYNYLEKVTLNDTILFMFPGYRYFLYSWVDLQVRLAEIPWEGYGETHSFLDIAENSLTERVILSNVVRDIMGKQTSRIKVNEEAIERAERLGAGEEFIEMIRKNVRVMLPLTSGNPAMDFEILDSEGNTAGLKDFRGKYLLIDVWSTTCSPCIREIPRLHDIKNEMKGCNLEIIAVCLSDEDPWKNKMKELGVPAGGQYRVEGGWGSQFSKDYVKFSGVPVYIIIDPEGKIVTARAPYPSKGLKEVLGELPV